jgi:hypothetical protein
MYDNFSEASHAASKDIEEKTKKINEIIGNFSAIPYKMSFEEAKKDLSKYMKDELGTYEYFAVDDNGHDSSEYLIVTGSEDFRGPTALGTVTYRANPVPKIAMEAINIIERRIKTNK